ncbi:MAG: S-layer homology domain-containing protein [Acidimicrobiia bacterium]|nr:S-layer homology domain-containing protein [Acidimicrobiia bacterium]
MRGSATSTPPTPSTARSPGSPTPASPPATPTAPTGQPPPSPARRPRCSWPACGNTWAHHRRPTDPGFSDVDPTHPFHREIAWFADTGITTGYPDGTFRPGAEVTRQAAATFLHRFWHTFATRLVSVATDGTQTNDRSRESAISADGRYIAFESRADRPRPRRHQR